MTILTRFVEEMDAAVPQGKMTAVSIQQHAAGLHHLGKAKLQLNDNAASPAACEALRRAAELYDPAPESFAEDIAVCGVSTKVVGK